METIEIIHDSIPLEVPIISNKTLEITWDSYKEVPDFCGAGKGIGDLVVPETALFLRISLA